MNCTIRFNVGGTTYQVCHSLIKLYPDSMLARITSEQWHENTDSEIFIERDGTRFRFVLDYMRDRKIILPVSESKESLLAELRYYCLEFDENNICDTKAKRAVCVPSLIQTATEIESRITTTSRELFSLKFADEVVKQISRKLRVGRFNLQGFPGTFKDLHDIYTREHKDFTPKQMVKKVNVHLNSVGLKLVNFVAYSYIEVRFLE